MAAGHSLGQAVAASRLHAHYDRRTGSVLLVAELVEAVDQVVGPAAVM